MAEESVQPEVQDNNQVASQTGDIDKLFNVVSSKGLYTKSKDEFLQKYSTPESIDKLFQVVSDKGLYTKSKGDFYSKYYPNLSSQPKTEQKVQPIQNAIDINQPFKGMGNAPAAKPSEIVNPKDKFLNIGEPVAPTTLKNRGGVQMGITDAIKSDKQIDSLLGGLYNEAIGGLSSLASGVAFGGSFGGASSMGSVGGAMPIDNQERLKGAIAIGNATRGLVEQARSESSSKENEQRRGETDWSKGITLGNLGGLAFGTPRLAVDLTAGALTGGGSFFAQGMGSALEELDRNKDADKLTPNQKLGYIATSGMVNGILMKVGFDKILKSTGLTDVVSKKIINEVTEDFIKKGIVKATTKDIEDATMQKVSSFLAKAKRVGIKTATSAATGSTIGAVQQGSNDAIKILTNKATGNEIFNEQEIKDNFGKNMLNAFVSGGVIGTVMGLGHSALENTNKSIRSEVSKAQSPQDIEAIKQKINENYEAGNITAEEAQAANIKIEDYTQIAAKIPEEITSDRKYAIIGGIEQREGIKNEIQSTQDELNSTDEFFKQFCKPNVTV